MPSPVGNMIIKGIINSPLHPILGDRFALITVIGRKSGTKYCTPINVIPLGEDLTTISLHRRTWWRNLRAGALASLRHHGKNIQVHAEVIESPPEVTAGLETYFHRFPGDARYFKIQLDPGGKPDPQALARFAGDHVLIRFHPA